MKRFFALLIALMMVFALAACDEDTGKNPSGGTDNPGGSQTMPGGDTADGWFSASDLSAVVLSGLKQPAETTVKSSFATNVKLSGMTDANYKAWVADAFALITEKNGGVYEAETDSSFKLVGYKKIASLSASDVSTDELPSFDLVYKSGDKVYSLYILYYPVDYPGESAGYAEVRIADMTSEWGGLPFND